MKFGLASVVVICGSIAAGAFWPSSAYQLPDPAASFPARPVQVVVPFAAGGSSDVVVRALVQTISKSWNQPVVIDNRVGATGAIAGEYVVRQPVDGHTLLNAAPTSHTALRALRHDLPYNPMSDLTPVTLLVIAPMMLVVNPTKVPARTVPELIDYLKKNPGKLTYASTGIGSVAHLSVELFKILTETDMVHVPYRGNAPALTDLLAGNVDLTIDVSSSVASHLKSGALRSLGVTTAKRSSFDPDMPAVAEAVPGFQAFSWNGIVVRTGTPPSIIEKVGREFASAVQQPQVKEMLARILMEPVGSSPAEFDELIKADAARWDRVVSALKLNPGQK
ncbi:MAG: tripartite tricarboxylate transporter substrate binding protein [Alphaproteobacteria bacterium]|nr:tripartite tricarboxylate transporter substrate binding protein [Alphaproteobacteria bacterium]